MPALLQGGELPVVVLLADGRDGAHDFDGDVLARTKQTPVHMSVEPPND